MGPGADLTQPSLQAMVEGGVIMHSVPGFEWYLILERNLPSFLQSPPRLLFTSFVSQSEVAQ
jgi:hypothetical protein